MAWCGSFVDPNEIFTRRLLAPCFDNVRSTNLYDGCAHASEENSKKGRRLPKADGWLGVSHNRSCCEKHGADEIEDRFDISMPSGGWLCRPDTTERECRYCPIVGINHSRLNKCYTDDNYAHALEIVCFDTPQDYMMPVCLLAEGGRFNLWVVPRAMTRQELIAQSGRSLTRLRQRIDFAQT